MQKKYMIIFSLVFSLALTACGNSTKDQNLPNPVASTANKETTPVMTSGGDHSTNPLTQSDMQKKMDELAYTEFELEVEYANNQEYEAELEKSSNNMIHAKIDDSFNNVYKTSADAFNELYPLVKKLTITQQTSKNDAIQEILTTFSLPANYQKFDLELQFKDGTQLKYEDKK